MKKQLNTTLIYILSIIGLLCCCIWGIGLFLSGPAYLIARNKVKDASENPEDYEGNINAMNTAKTVALIVLIINALYLIYTLYVIFTVGYDEILDKWDEIMLEIKNNS
jgi:hypothetical protein